MRVAPAMRDAAARRARDPHGDATDVGHRHRRLPGPDVVRAVALIGVVVMNFHGYLILRGGRQGDERGRPLLRSVERAAVDPLRRDVRARRRRRRDAADPPRRDARAAAGRWSGPAAGRSSAAGSCCTAPGCCSTRSGRGRSCPTTGRCSSSARLLFTLRAALARRRRAGRRAGRRRHRLVAARTAARRATTRTGCSRPVVGRREACCSTSSSTAPIRCCRGWPSSAPGSCSGVS